MNIIIVFKTNRIARIDNATDYGFIDNGRMFYFLKDGTRSFIPADNVLYFGREEDWYSV